MHKELAHPELATALVAWLATHDRVEAAKSVLREAQADAAEAEAEVSRLGASIEDWIWPVLLGATLIECNDSSRLSVRVVTRLS